MAIPGLPINIAQLLFGGGSGNGVAPDQVLNAGAMGGAEADPEMSGWPSAAGATPPFIEKRDRYGDYQRRADEIYNKELKPRSRIESLLTIVQPLAKGFAAAMAQPGYRRNRAFWSTLAGEGAATGLQEVARPRILKQQARTQALNEIHRMAQLAREERMGRGSQTLHQAIDNRTGKKVFITNEMLQANPSGYTWAEKDQREANPAFAEQDVGGGNMERLVWKPDAKHPAGGYYIPAEIRRDAPSDAQPTGVLPTPSAPIAGPAGAGVLSGARARGEELLQQFRDSGQASQAPASATAGTTGGKFFLSRKGDTAAAKEAAKEAAKIQTLDQQYAEAIERGDEPAQATILKSMRRKAVATHIREAKGPTAGEERDKRNAEAFDAAKQYVDYYSERMASADPVEIFKRVMSDVYTKASKSGDTRAKASIPSVEREVYRQLFMRFRNTGREDALTAYFKKLAGEGAAANSE